MPPSPVRHHKQSSQLSLSSSFQLRLCASILLSYVLINVHISTSFRSGSLPALMMEQRLEMKPAAWSVQKGPLEEKPNSSRLLRTESLVTSNTPKNNVLHSLYLIYNNNKNNNIHAQDERVESVEENSKSAEGLPLFSRNRNESSGEPEQFQNEGDAKRAVSESERLVGSNYQLSNSTNERQIAPKEVVDIPSDYRTALPDPSPIKQNSSTQVLHPETKTSLRKASQHSKKNSTTAVSVPTNSTTPQQEQEYFASCLLIMDENHRLPEWLAYHYYMLPLRHLVILVDPRSKTRPDEIVQRWRHFINIQLWGDEEIGHEPEETTDPEELKDQHRQRQRLFYKNCSLHFKELRRPHQLVTFHDADEFIYLDKDAVWDAAHRMQKPGSILTFLKQLRRVAEKKKKKSHLTEEENPHNFTTRLISFGSGFRHDACFMISRVYFNGIENSTERVQLHVPNYLNGSHFETLRWMRRTSNGDSEHNGLGKCVLDASLLPKEPEFVPRPGGIHRVVEDCPLTDFHYSPIRIRHYLGSWEYYSSREDARVGINRSRETWEFKSQYAMKGKRWGWDDDVRLWLSGFCQAMGHNETLIKHLLKGLADLPEAPPGSKDHWGILPWVIAEEIDDMYEEGYENFASWLKARFDVKTLKNGTVVAKRRQIAGEQTMSPKTQTKASAESDRKPSAVSKDTKATKLSKDTDTTDKSTKRVEVGGVEDATKENKKSDNHSILQEKSL